MSVALYRGQQLGPNDLDIYLANNAGRPTDAAEIHYALYDFTTGQEVLLGVPRREPGHPSVGHYYASVVIPLDARLGDYRVRWTFRETIGGPVQQVVQEFAVVDKVIDNTTSLSNCERAAVNSLRILLRDNCVGEEEEVELDVDGERMVVTFLELWEALHDLSPSPP